MQVGILQLDSEFIIAEYAQPQNMFGVA